MQIIEKRVPYDFNLFLFGDDHMGTKLRHDEGWEKLLSMMSKKYMGVKDNFGVDHGDVVECIPSHDKRWSPDTADSLPLRQIEQAVSAREPIKEKLVVILDGNHPLKYHRFGRVTNKVCSDLGVTYGTYTAHITYKTKNGAVLFRQYATHGRRNINSTADDPVRRESNMKLGLKRHMKNKFADCGLMSKGHTHKLLIVPPTKSLYMTADSKLHQNYTDYDLSGKYIHPDHRWYINTGSFLRLYGLGVSGYGELAEYDPLELGFVIVRVRKGKIEGADKIVLATPEIQETQTEE